MARQITWHAAPIQDQRQGICGQPDRGQEVCPLVTAQIRISCQIALKRTNQQPVQAPLTTGRTNL